MSPAILILKQVLVMFLLAGAGLYLYRTKRISDEGARTIGSILIYASLPCVIINNFLKEFSIEKLIGLPLSY